MASSFPRRRPMLAAFSHSAWKRCTSLSSGARSPRSATSSRNAPPASTADSCAQSPTSSTLAPASSGGAHQFVEGERPGQAGLVHDHQLAAVQPAGLDGLVQGGQRRRPASCAGRQGHGRVAAGPASRPRRAVSSGTRRHSVSHLAVFSVAIPSSSASTSAAAADGARPITEPGPCSASQAARRPAMVVDLPVPAGPTRTSRTPPGGGHLLDRQGLVGAQPVGRARAGRPLAGRATVATLTAGAVLAPARVEQPGLGVEQRLGGVQRPALGPQARRAVGAAVAGRGVAHLGAGDRERGRPVASRRHPLGHLDAVRRALRTGRRAGPGGPRPGGSCG